VIAKSKKWIVRGYLSEDNNLYYEVEAETEEEAITLAEQEALSEFPRDLIKWADYVAEPYTEERSWGKV
jgi:hypothetical protein